VVGDGDAVDVCFEDGGVVTDDCGYFGCGDVFGFPAEGIAEAVEEEPAAVGVAAECVC